MGKEEILLRFLGLDEPIKSHGVLSIDLNGKDSHSNCSTKAPSSLSELDNLFAELDFKLCDSSANIEILPCDGQYEESFLAGIGLHFEQAT